MMSRMPRFSAKSPLTLGKGGMGPMFSVILIAFLFVLAFLIYQMVVGKGGEGFSEGLACTSDSQCTGSTNQCYNTVCRKKPASSPPPTMKNSTCTIPTNCKTYNESLSCKGISAVTHAGYCA